MKLRLFQSLKSIKVSGFGLAFQGQGPLEIPVTLPRLQKASVAKVLSGWEVQFQGEKKPVIFVGEKIRIVGEMMKINGKAVPNSTHLVAKSNSHYDVISEMPLETYLEGVLPSEMPGGWPLEALKAQAVASRTYTLKVMEDRQNKSFHLESTVEDQVYNHLNVRGARESIRQKIRRALVGTKDKILKRNGQVITSYYHADCGGQTEEPYRVWGNEERNGSVKDVACPLSPNGSWQVELSQNWLSEKLRNFFHFNPERKFERLFVAARTPSGRVEELEAHFEGEIPQTMSAQELRRLMGFKKIKSTNFHMQWKNSEVVVHGRGHGHGVGLCQYGARYLALRGLKYKEILAHYYPQTQLVSQ